jgi:dTDP-4-dehydrorhamnose reductase
MQASAAAESGTESRASARADRSADARDTKLAKVANKLPVSVKNDSGQEHQAESSEEPFEVFATYFENPISYPDIKAYPVDLSRFADIETLFLHLQPDVVVHTAAWSELDPCEKEPEQTFRINTEATGLIAQICGDMNYKLIFTSSDMIFDGEKGNYSESDEPNPISVYGESKLKAEELIKDLCPDHVLVRVALTYGKPLSGNRSFSEWIQNKVKAGEEVPLFTDQLRSPVLVQDLADAILELADSAHYGTIHLGGADGVDRYTFGKKLAELKGFSPDCLKPVSLADVDFVAKRPKDLSFNTNLAREVLRSPLSGFNEGLKQA